MIVLVTGATGFVGREVLRQLQAAGQAIRILARYPASSSVSEAVARYAVEVRAGNVLQPESLDDAMTGCDAVIHLVGIISEVGDQTFENVHARATQNVVAAAKRGGVRRFLHMSALGTRPGAVSRYHRSKWAAEEAVRQSGLDWTIFRPSLIFGPQDQFVNLFARMARFSPVLPVMGPGRAKFQPVAIEDVAMCFVKALTETRSVGQTCDLCGPDSLTMPEILDAVLSATGRKRWKLRVPLGLARFQVACLEFVFPRLLGKAPPLNRDQLTMLQEDNVGNPQPANELFGLKPIRFREGISRYLK